MIEPGIGTHFFSVSNKVFLSRSGNVFISKDLHVPKEHWKYKKGHSGYINDFAYFSSHLQTKETGWKQGDAMFLEPEILWSSFGQLW